MLLDCGVSPSRIEEEFSLFFSSLPPQLLREINAVFKVGDLTKVHLFTKQ